MWLLPAQHLHLLSILSTVACPFWILNTGERFCSYYSDNWTTLLLGKTIYCFTYRRVHSPNKILTMPYSSPVTQHQNTSSWERCSQSCCCCPGYTMAESKVLYSCLLTLRWNMEIHLTCLTGIWRICLPKHSYFSGLITRRHMNWRYFSYKCTRQVILKYLITTMIFLQRKRHCYLDLHLND